jgi:hypothetical protein
MHIDRTGPVTAHAGDTFVYTLTVTYDGTNGDGSPVSGVSVSDDIGSVPQYIGGDDGDRRLEPGETWTYAATYTVQYSDPYALIATCAVEGYDRDGDLVRDTHVYVMDIHGVMRPRLYLPLIFRQN